MPFIETDPLNEFNKPIEGYSRDSLFQFWCEICGSKIVTTLEDAYKQGYDTFGMYGAKVLSPRTCGKKSCTIEKTTWWKIAVEKDKNLTKHDIEVIQKILSEPDGIAVKEGENNE